MAGSGTAAWLPKRPDQAPAEVSGPRFHGSVPEGDRPTQVGGRATRPFRFGSEDRPDPDPPLALGSLVGERYRIVRLLGEGGMGRVYEAEHTVLRRRVALKLLRRDAAAEPENLARFRQEALAASRVGAPQIVEIVDFASHAGAGGAQAYMVMELLAGESLEDWMDRSASLDEGLAILAELCDGLAAAHRAEVVHRDIKPANVFLREFDPTRADPTRVKILDFGIAKITAGGEGFQTRQGSLLGTPYYLAPERVMGAELTGAADLYSVGVILYEMLTGNVPFVADSFMGILANHVHTPALDPRQAAPDRPIPASVARLCLRLLDKDPRARPPAEPVAGELRGLLARERAAIAAVVTGPRASVAGPREDTQVLDEATHELPLSERPTQAPIDAGPRHPNTDAGALAQSGRVATRIGHAAVGSAEPALAGPGCSTVEAAVSVAGPEPVGRGPTIGLAVALGVAAIVGGVWWLGGREDRVITEQATTVEEPSTSAEPAPGDLPVEPPPTLSPSPSQSEPTANQAAGPEPTPVQPASGPAPEPTGERVGKRENRELDEEPAARPNPKPNPKPRPEPKPAEQSEAPAPEPVIDPQTPDPPPPGPGVDPELPTIKDDVYD